jgi:deazaflavin-dependent oxidoreductase (nitroreductase family)
VKRRFFRWWWKIVNPLSRPVAGYLPWWVLVETVGNKTGKVRRIPLAAGRNRDDSMWLVAVHGRRSGWVCNLEAGSPLRVQHLGRWHAATAAVHELDAAKPRDLTLYQRIGLLTASLDPSLVSVQFTD